VWGVFPASLRDSAKPQSEAGETNVSMAASSVHWNLKEHNVKNPLMETPPLYTLLLQPAQIHTLAPKLFWCLERIPSPGKKK